MELGISLVALMLISVFTGFFLGVKKGKQLGDESLRVTPDEPNAYVGRWCVFCKVSPRNDQQATQELAENLYFQTIGLLSDYGYTPVNTSEEADIIIDADIVDTFCHKEYRKIYTENFNHWAKQCYPQFCLDGVFFPELVREKITLDIEYIHDLYRQACNKEPLVSVDFFKQQIEVRFRVHFFNGSPLTSGIIEQENNPLGINHAVSRLAGALINKISKDKLQQMLPHAALGPFQQMVYEHHDLRRLRQASLGD